MQEESTVLETSSRTSENAKYGAVNHTQGERE